MAGAGAWDLALLLTAMVVFVNLGLRPLVKWLKRYTRAGVPLTRGYRVIVTVAEAEEAMARSMMPDSAGSQFFIMTSDSPHLDGQYAAFGKVLEGMDVADAIVSVKRDMRDKPLEPQVMKSIRVETFGQTYPFEQM